MTTLITPLLSSSPPPPPLLTAEEFFERYNDSSVELVKGVVREMPTPGGKHGMICATMARLLGNHVAEHALGQVLTNDTSLVTRRKPDGVRGMDVAFVSYARIPKGTMPAGMLEVAPELVVEVRSPSETWTELFTKVVEYLSAGVGVVVVLDPETRTASVYHPNTLQEILRAEDTLTFPDVLPGFAVEVARLFE